jgi:hypothetical protein
MLDLGDINNTGNRKVYKQKGGDKTQNDVIHTPPNLAFKFPYGNTPNGFYLQCPDSSQDFPAYRPAFHKKRAPVITGAPFKIKFLPILYYSSRIIFLEAL